MKQITKVRLLKYGITGLLCAGVAIAYLSAQNLEGMALKDVYRVVCDAFTLPGLLLVFSGALVALANEGTLDGVGFVLSYAVNALIPGRNGKITSYRDYVEEKRQKRTKGYGFLLITGVCSLAIAVIFLVLYYSV